MSFFENIFNNIIIMSTTYYCSIFFFVKAKRIRITRSRIIVLVIGEIAVILIASFGGNYHLLSKSLYIIGTILSILLLEKDCFADNIPISVFSVGIAYALEYSSVIIAGLLLYFFVDYRSADILSTLVSCIIQLFLLLLVVRIKRITKGVLYFVNAKNYGLGLILSAYILAFSLIITEYKIFKGSSLEIALLFCVPLALTGLILWIRSIVQHYYKNKLQDRVNEYTKQEMEDKDRHIERLEAEVATLAKQLHRDNHLLSSLERSMQSFAECETEEQREQIIEEIQTLCSERNELIAKEQQSKILPSTGIALIDGSLSELYVKAVAHGISFDLTVNEELHYLINNIISQTVLQTMLCDHVKDALIAVESAGVTDGRILIAIDKNDGIFEIAIRDNGVDFDVDTLSKLGKEQVTTHADEGGSGIGFMTTFETLRKTKGSLSITEYEKKTPFSKSVVFTFDGLNRFIIRSYRKDELEKAIKRDDVLIVC